MREGNHLAAKPMFIRDGIDAAMRELAQEREGSRSRSTDPETSPGEFARRLGLNVGARSQLPHTMGAMLNRNRPSQHEFQSVTLPEIMPSVFGPPLPRAELLGGGLTEPRSSRLPPRFETPPKPFPENPIGTKFCDAWKETYWKDLTFNLLTRRLNWNVRLNVPSDPNHDPKKEDADSQGSNVGAAILPLLESLGIDLCWPNDEVARHNGEIARGRFPPELLKDWKEIRKLRQPPLPTADQAVLDDLVVSHLETFVAGYVASGNVTCDSLPCPIPPGQCAFVNEFLGYQVLGVFERLDFVRTAEKAVGWIPPNLAVWDFQAVCSIDANVRVYFTMACECLRAPKDHGF